MSLSLARVANLRHEDLGEAVYVGRANPRRGLAGSAFGNPFTIGQDGNRAEVIEKYRQWILGQTSLLVRLKELRGKRLACWCSPEPCHADVLLDLVDADELLVELKAADVSVEAVDGKLRLRPASRVSEPLRLRMASRKQALVSLVEALAIAGTVDATSQKADRDECQQPVADTVEEPAAPRVECEPLRHEPVAAGQDSRGWTRLACRKCGRFYSYAPPSSSALRPALETI